MIQITKHLRPGLAETHRCFLFINGACQTCGRSSYAVHAPHAANTGPMQTNRRQRRARSAARQRIFKRARAESENP